MFPENSELHMTWAYVTCQNLLSSAFVLEISKEAENSHSILHGLCLRTAYYLWKFTENTQINVIFGKETIFPKEGRVVGLTFSIQVYCSVVTS